MVEDLLSTQQKMLFSELDGGGKQIAGVIAMADDDWEELIRKIYLDVGLEFGKDVVVERREVEDPLSEALDSEMDILREKTDIQDGTIDKIDKQMKEGVKQGWSTGQLQQAILDTGIFDSARALRIARTVSGAAASQGQWISGKLVGADTKIWSTAGDSHVRPRHQKLDGKAVGIDGLFPNGGRYPGDSLLSAAERINCRCALMFELRGKGELTPDAILPGEEVSTKKWISHKNMKELDEEFYELGLGTFYKAEGMSDASAAKIINGTGEHMTDVFDRFPVLDDMAKNNKVFDFQLEKGSGWRDGDSLTIGEYNYQNRSIRIASGKKKADTLSIGNKKHNIGNDYNSTVRHEYGHHTYRRSVPFEQKKEFKELWKSSGEKKFFEKEVSKYAGTSSEEAFCECFSAFTSPKYNTGKNTTLPKDIEDFFIKLFGTGE